LGALGRHAFNVRTSTVTRVERTKAYRAEILGEAVRLHPVEPAPGAATPRLAKPVSLRHDKKCLFLTGSCQAARDCCRLKATKRACPVADVCPQAIEKQWNPILARTLLRSD